MEESVRGFLRIMGIDVGFSESLLGSLERCLELRLPRGPRLGPSGIGVDDEAIDAGGDCSLDAAAPVVLLAGVSVVAAFAFAARRGEEGVSPKSRWILAAILSGPPRSLRRSDRGVVEVSEDLSEG